MAILPRGSLSLYLRPMAVEMGVYTKTYDSPAQQIAMLRMARASDDLPPGADFEMIG